MDTPEIILICILMAVFVENMTEVFVKDEVLDSLRLLIFKIKRPKVIAELTQAWVSCGRCCSGVLSLVSAFYIFFLHLDFTVFWFIVMWNLIWFLSNIMHHLRDRINPNYNLEEH